VLQVEIPMSTKFRDFYLLSNFKVYLKIEIRYQHHINCIKITEFFNQKS